MITTMNPHLEETLAEWATSYPRRVGKSQITAEAPEAVLRAVSAMSDEPAYISVYGFPRGHTTEGGIPDVDTLMFDFDIPSGGMYGRPSSPGEADRAAWRADMTKLLKLAINPFAQTLVESGHADVWRAALSGHKGVHFYLDFPVLDPEIGSSSQFKRGLKSFANDFLAEIDRQSGKDVSLWVDVDSSDLSRLTRLPNTLHEGATRNFGEPRYCVPVSIEELATLTADDYERLTAEPRPLPPKSRRVESRQAGKVVEHRIKLADDASESNGGKWTYDPNRVSRYDSQAIRATAEHIPRLLKEKPCLLAFVDDPEIYDHGDQSHQMKLALLSQLTNLGVSSEEIIAFLDERTPEHDSDCTRDEIDKVLSYNYNRWKAETLWLKAPRFCRPDLCTKCRDAHT